MSLKLTATERMRKRFERAVPGHGSFGAKSAVTDAETDVANRLVKAWVSTTEPDQEGDVVLPDGADMSYFPTRVKAVYLNHDYDKPIGVCRKMAVRDNGLWALTYIATTDLGNETLTLVNEGVIGGMSIGFRTMKADRATDDEKSVYGDETQRMVREYKLVEYSLTAMPMNQGALIQKGLRDRVSRDMLDALELDVAKPRTVVELRPRPIKLPRTVDI